jgi:hypothetical protein
MMAAFGAMLPIQDVRHHFANRGKPEGRGQPISVAFARSGHAPSRCACNAVFAPIGATTIET